MIEWWTLVQGLLAAAAGVFCFVRAGMNAPIGDGTAAASALGWLALLIDAVLAVVAPMTGNPCRGDSVEFWAYLITALMIPPAALFWGLLERNRWSTMILGVAMLAVAVMMVRMQQIWAGQAALITG